MTTTALVLAILALFLSVLSLAWQAWTWSRSGPVLAVKVSNAVTDAGNMLGKPEVYVQVTVENQGRAAITVSSWGIEIPGKQNIYVTRPESFSSQLPGRLEPHAQLSFFIEHTEVRQVAASNSIPFKQMRAWVQPATGSKVYAKRGVPLA